MASETIVRCGCGAQVRLPASADPSFRCPDCNAALVEPIDARIVSAAPRDSAETSVTCPICQTTIAADESVINCSACDQLHHDECWSEVGGCGTYGCTRAPVVEKVAPQIPTTVWGDTKLCPMCGESIKAMALRCRFCSTDFDTTDPLTRADLKRQQVRAGEQQKLKTITLLLFVVGLIGLTAPLVGLITSGYLMPRRDRLWKCGPLYSFLAWMTLVVSGVFTTLIAVFLIFEWV